MHKRLLRQLPVMGLALGLLAAASAVRADDAAQPPSARPEAASDNGSPQQHDQQQAQQQDQVKQVSAKSVSLPADTEVEKKRPNRPLLVTSSALFAAAYIPTFITAMANSKDTKGTLFIPVAGPWIELGNDTSPGNKVLLVFSGLAQTLGAAGIIGSFFIPEKKTEKWHLMGNNRFSISPVAGRGNYHLVARGTF